MEYMLVALIGIGATAIADAWSLARKFLMHVAPPDYGLVGRWFAHMAYGRFRHASIAAATRMRGEVAIGWAAHYAIGILYAAALVSISPDWLANPTPFSALAMGIATVSAPFFLMQPAMGAGIAASRTARPWTARFHSVLMHTVFGIGLYLAGSTANSLRHLN
jgi:hypothetical protein